MARRCRFVVTLAAVWLLVISSCRHALSGPPSLPPLMRPPRNVVLIGWDGVQRDHLKEMIALGQMPNLMELAAQGNLVAIDITRTTDTKAGWAQILTGYEPETTGVFSDSWFRPVPAGYTAFERLEALFGRDNIYTAAVIAKKDNLGTRSPSPDGTFPGEPYYFTQNNMDLFVNGLGAADNVGARALQVLDEHGRGRFFLFVHFQEPDIQGHSYGENSAEYSAAVRHNDEWLGRIVAELEELGVRRETSVYVCSDHGFDEGLKTHSDAPYVFLATDDLLVKRRGLREDIAPTILWRFGLNLWAVSPPLDGHPLQMIYRAPDW